MFCASHGFMALTALALALAATVGASCCVLASAITPARSIFLFEHVSQLRSQRSVTSLQQP